MRARTALAAFAAIVLLAAALTAALASRGGADTSATVYSCLSGGQLNRVSLDTPRPCPSSATPIAWAGQRVAPSPTSTSPSPTSTSPSPSPTVTSTSPSPTGTACVKTGTNDSCPYAYPGITGSSVSTTYVNQEVWNPPPGFTSGPCPGPAPCQQLTAYDPGNWSVTADYTSSGGAVLAYPDVQQLYSGQALSSLTTLTSTFTETMNAGSGTAAEAAYDLWLNNWATEVMIWVDATPAQAAALQYDTDLGAAVIGGQAYELYRNGGPGGELILSLITGEQSGTVDLLAALGYLAGRGLIGSSPTLAGADFGFEIASTGGAAETFTVSQYSLTSA